MTRHPQPVCTFTGWGCSVSTVTNERADTMSKMTTAEIAVNECEIRDNLHNPVSLIVREVNSSRPSRIRGLVASGDAIARARRGIR